MNDTQALIHALKRSLKAAGCTYHELADMLGLSESSVKRIFASGDNRLFKIHTQLSNGKFHHLAAK